LGGKPHIAEACFEAGRGLLGPMASAVSCSFYRSCDMGFRRACEDGPGMAEKGPERERFLALACRRGVHAACIRSGPTTTK